MTLLAAQEPEAPVGDGEPARGNGTTGPRVGYVLKVFPRYSETFVLNELLAHERAGWTLDVFSLRAPLEGRFHPGVAQLRSPVTYVTSGAPNARDVWEALQAMERGSGLRERDLHEILEADVADAQQALTVALAVQERGITHLHAHFGSVATTVARLAARLAGITYSFTAHAKDIFHDDVDGDELCRKLAEASAVVTVSDFNRAHLQCQFGTSARKVVRIYNGVDLTVFEETNATRRGKTITAVGRLVEKKGFRYLVEACASLARRSPDFTCRIVGSGPLEAELRAQSVRLGLEGIVELIGPQPQDEVARLVGESAAFAAPCVVADDGNRDGLPTVLLEAMALGTPVVATPVTGIPELVRDGETGLLVPESDVDALASALARLLDDRPLARRLASSARARVERDFSLPVQASALRQVLTVAARAPVA